jgi:hypothetical protein
MNNSTTPTTDKRRAATILLACLDDDADAVNQVLDEAHADPGGLHGLLAQLAAGCIELMGIAGEDGARKTLSMTLLDVSMHDEEAENG